MMGDDAGRVVSDRFIQFLKDFTIGEPDGSSQFTQAFKDYTEQVHQMKEYDQSTMYVDFGQLMAHDHFLAEAISTEFYRFEPHVRTAVFEFVRDVEPEFAGTPDRAAREFFVSFYNIATRHKVRDLKTALIGHLVSFSGTVTRASEVRPELLYGVFTCDICSQVSGKIEQQFKYTEPSFCTQPRCSNRTKWTLDVSSSQFVDWQRVRVQENPDEIPPGSMPRSVDVVLRHAAVEKAKAGDKCTFTGTMIVIPDVSQLFKAGQAPRSFQGGAGERESEGFTGLKALGVRDLTYRTAFLASSVTTDASRAGGASNAAGTSQVDVFTQSERDTIEEMRRDPDLYRKMVRSIAPTVYGHDEVKRGILLMLLGGVPKTTPDGSRLRGDINVCIVGDPATAKSQFLKYTCKFVPRAVYTSGKASSAAGLTASVMKDPETGEFAIEAGALMLADNGVCCIDEFDKMDIVDQVAIHEAMEQQTISITKAGIQATLNARASILAAANPIMGRYDKSKPLRHNITLSPAIMSRFDLFFVVLDDLDEVIDIAIAKHIVGIHQRKEEALDPDFPIAVVQKYVAFARTLNPKITAEAKKAIVSCYKTLRQNDVVGSSQIAYRITVRQLESMIRLSEALARLHLDNEVRPMYVHEAFRLLQQSIIRVDTHDIVFTREDLGEAKEGEEAKEVSEVVTFAKYQRVSRMIAMHLRHLEDAGDAGKTVGVKQGELIEWYLGQQEFETVDALAKEQEVIKQIIENLLSKDHVLYVLEGADAVEENDRLIALDPDFVIA